MEPAAAGSPRPTATPSEAPSEGLKEEEAAAAEGGGAVQRGQGKNSAWLTAGIIVADVVGAGILGMPAAVAKFGWMLGGVVLVAMLGANVHISLLLWRVRMGCPHAVGARTYTDLCTAAFALAPVWQRRAAVLAAGVSQLSFLFGLMGLYLLSAGKGLGMMFYAARMCLPQWALIGAALLLPFAATAREMGYYKSLIWLNILTLCGTVVIPLVFYMLVGVDNIRLPNSAVHAFVSPTPAGLLSGLSTFAFAMTSQFILPEIISEMKDPSELARAYAGISAPFQLAAFLAAGLGGYWFMGDKASGMINENLPFGATLQVAAACLVAHMLISYLLKAVVLCRAVQEAVDPEHADPDNKQWRSRTSWGFIAASALGATWLLANLVPFFGDAVDILGASFTPLSCWVLPIGMFARWYADTAEGDRPRVSRAECALMLGELALSMVLMVLGTISAVRTLVEHWHTYGFPFACHCEGIWATCACSAGHVGMESCPALGGR